MRRAALPLVVVLAAVLRFGTLSATGYWGDELSTVSLVQQKFVPMLDSIARLESTPPLYYSLAWLWAKVFGTTEAGLRSLSALLGVATVPAVYVAARELVSRRAALVAAILVAVNPMLVWFSNEARSYSLLAFLSAVGLYWFARALREQRRSDLAWWALASILAFATHYFSAFLVLPEAVLLARAWRDRRALVLTFAAAGAAGAGLLPLMLHQRSLGHASWISHDSIGARLLGLAAQFAVGFDSPMLTVVGAAGAVLVMAGAVLVVKRVADPDRWGANLALGLAASAIAVPLVLALGGLDYFSARNELAALVPITIALAAGFSTPGLRVGRVAGGLLIALSLTVMLATAGQPKFHSEDWRAAAEDLGAPSGPRAIVAAPGQAGRKPLEYYLGAKRIRMSTRAPVREVDVVALPRQGHSRVPPGYLRRLMALRLPGFERGRTVLDGPGILLAFRSSRPVTVSASSLQRAVGWGAPRVLLQAPATNSTETAASTADAGRE